MKLFLYSGSGYLALVKAQCLEEAREYLGRYDALDKINSWFLKEVKIPFDVHGKCKILWINEV